MIKRSTPLTIAEVVNLAKESEKEIRLKAFSKQFIKISEKEAKEMKEELQNLDLIKLKEDNIVKVIDFMPRDVVDLTKILSGISLNQDEVDKILGVIKKY
jgi:DNA-directed RNA polymerase subunit F